MKSGFIFRNCHRGFRFIPFTARSGLSDWACLWQIVVYVPPMIIFVFGQAFLMSLIDSSTPWYQYVIVVWISAKSAGLFWIRKSLNICRGSPKRW